MPPTPVSVGKGRIKLNTLPGFGQYTLFARKIQEHAEKKEEDFIGFLVVLAENVIAFDRIFPIASGAFYFA